MRLFYSLLVIFAVVILFGFWTNHLLQTSANDLLQHTEKIARELEKENWNTAYEEIIEFEKTWDKKSKWWPMILDHQEIDNIEFSQVKVKEYIFTKNTALSWGQLSELKLMIKHVPEKESLSIKNIL